MKEIKQRLERIEKMISPQLHNSGVIVHPPELSQDGHAELYDSYPESKGYRHIVIELVGGDTDCIADSA